jgi:hypothetical protein
VCRKSPGGYSRRTGHSHGLCAVELKAGAELECRKYTFAHGVIDDGGAELCGVSAEIACISVVMRTKSCFRLVFRDGVRCFAGVYGCAKLEVVLEELLEP